MKLGMVVGLDPGHIVLDRDPAPPRKGEQQPPTTFEIYRSRLGACFHIICGPRVMWPNGWMDQDAIWYGGRPRPSPHCVRWGPSSPVKKRHSSPQFSVHVLWPNGRPSQLLPSTCLAIVQFYRCHIQPSVLYIFIYSSSTSISSSKQNIRSVTHKHP